MVVTEFGITIFVKPVQFKKALLFMLVTAYELLLKVTSDGITKSPFADPPWFPTRTVVDEVTS